MRGICAAVSVAGLLAITSSASAIDIFPADYTVLPSGTNAVLLYGQYSYANGLNLDVGGGTDVPGSELGVGVGIARYLHYTDVAGVPVGLQVFLPFGGFTEARIGGVEQLTEDGIGDLTVGVTAWPIHSAEPTGTTLGVTLYATLPTGAYEFQPNTVNLGSGTWTLTPQIGLIQGLGGGFFFDGAIDVAFRGDHTENGVEISRDPSAQVQAYLRYQFSQATNVAVGYSGTFGGKDFQDNNYAFTQTRVDQIRATASTFLSPTLQLSGMIGTDVNVEGGFKNDFVGTVRLMKLF